jgi:hypothetical protein
MEKGTAPAHLIDRVYTLLHELEGEQHRRTEEHEASDWLDGVRTGTQAAKRQLILRLHWVLDPDSEAVDLEGAGPLTARLNPGQLPDTYAGEGEDDGSA